MKNIVKKFKWNPFTYVLLFAAVCTGFFKNILLILLIVIVHELGHIFMIRHFEYPILGVEIYPFGGITRVDKPINTPLKREILIALSGVGMQVLFFFLFFFLYHQGWILERTFFLFTSYNKVIFLFNLMPIIPLDGSILIHSFLEFFFPYKKAYSLYFLFSCVSLFFFATYHTLKSLNNYMILFFLFYKLYDAYQKKKHYLNRFFLERYLYEVPYQKISSHSYPDLDLLKKDTLHFFWMNDRYLHEKEFLKKRYQNKGKEMLNQR